MSPVAVPEVSSVMVRVGAVVSAVVVSKTCEACVAASLPLPAASVATSASTSTVMVPVELASGVTVSV